MYNYVDVLTLLFVPVVTAIQYPDPPSFPTRLSSALAIGAQAMVDAQPQSPEDRTGGVGFGLDRNSTRLNPCHLGNAYHDAELRNSSERRHDSQGVRRVLVDRPAGSGQVELYNDQLSI